MLSGALVSPKEREKLTFDDFLARYRDEDLRAEWVSGEVIVMAPASNRHQDVSDFLTVLMRAFAEFHRLGVVRSAPFLMRLQHSAREPDILFVAEEHLSRLKDTYLDGPADLVVEIVSPESRLRDRGEKFAEYEMAGVAEYWLIDPDMRRADFYVLGEDGRYERFLPDREGIYRSRVLRGFWLNVGWLWQSPLPPVLDTLRALRLIS